MCLLLNFYFSLQTLRRNCPSIRADIRRFVLRSVSFDGKTTVKSCAAKEFTIKLQIHITQNTLYAFTARHVFIRVPRRENINTLDVSATSIVYVRATNISNWFTRESRDKSVCYNFFLPFLSVIKGLLVIRNAYLRKNNWFSLIKYRFLIIFLIIMWHFVIFNTTFNMIKSKTER